MDNTVFLTTSSLPRCNLKLISPLTDSLWDRGMNRYTSQISFVRSKSFLFFSFLFLSFFLKEWDNYCRRLLRSSPLETRVSLGILDRPGRRLFNVFSLFSFLYWTGRFEWNIGLRIEETVDSIFEIGFL